MNTIADRTKSSYLHFQREVNIANQYFMSMNMEMHAYYLVLSDLCCAPHASSCLVKVYKATVRPKIGTVYHSEINCMIYNQKLFDQKCSIHPKDSKNFKNPEIIESGSKIRIRNPEIFFCHFFSDSFASIFRETNLSQN